MTPTNVAALVETRLRLRAERPLLACVCGGHQAFDERGLVTDAIERHLDRDDVLVTHGGIEEGLECRERVEGVCSSMRDI